MQLLVPLLLLLLLLLIFLYYTDQNDVLAIYTTDAVRDELTCAAGAGGED